jgi:hypothetical protein
MILHLDRRKRVSVERDNWLKSLTDRPAVTADDFLVSSERLISIYQVPCGGLEDLDAVGYAGEPLTMKTRGRKLLSGISEAQAIYYLNIKNKFAYWGPIFSMMEQAPELGRKYS